MAGDEGIHDEYSGHSAPSQVTESSMPMNTVAKLRVNYIQEESAEEVAPHEELFFSGKLIALGS